MIQELVDRLKKQPDSREPQLVAALVAAHAQARAFDSRFGLALQLIAARRRLAQLPYLQFCRLVSREPDFVKLLQPQLMQQLCDRLSEAKSPDLVEILTLVSRILGQRSMPLPRGLMKQLCFQLLIVSDDTAARKLVSLLHEYARVRENQFPWGQLCQLRVVGALLTVMSRFSCKRDVLALFAGLLKRSEFLDNFVRLDGIGTVAELASRNSRLSADDKSCLLNFLVLASDVGELAYEMKSEQFLQQQRSIIEGSSSFLELSLSCSLLASLSLDDQISLVISRTCAQTLFKRLLSLSGSKDRRVFADVEEEDSGRANSEASAMLAKVLRYTYSIEKNKVFIKRTLPSKLLALFIDIGNYIKPLLKYIPFVEALWRLSKEEREAIVVEAGRAEEQEMVGGYLIHEQLGKGAFGIVFRCSRELDEFAVKRMPVGQSMEKEVLDRYQNEIQVHKELVHPHVVRFFESFVWGGDLCIIMELVRGFSLAELIRLKRQKSAGFSEQEIWEIALGLLSVLHYLEARGLVHSDLNPSNILIDEYGRPKLADFGLCKFKQPDRNPNFAGTLQYSSPEALQGQPQSSKSDVWALGCTLYQLVNLHPAFPEDNPVALSKHIIALEFQPLREEHLSPKLLSVIRSCLTAERERPQAKTILLGCLPELLTFCSDLITQNSLLTTELVRNARLAGRGHSASPLLLRQAALVQIPMPLDPYLLVLRQLLMASESKEEFRGEGLRLYVQRLLLGDQLDCALVRSELERVIGRSDQQLRVVRLKGKGGQPLTYRHLCAWIQQHENSI